jgi:hypothetical protein
MRAFVLISLVAAFASCQMATPPKFTITYNQTATNTITDYDRNSVPYTGTKLAATLKDGYVTLKKGESAAANFINKGDKSAFLDIEY